MEKGEVKYNPFPLGQVPVHLQRPELHLLKALGKYTWNDDREVIDIFEKKVAEFWGAKYAVAVDCCTHAVELSLRYLIISKKLNPGRILKIPARTYISVYQTIQKLGLEAVIEDFEWKGQYYIGNTPVIDAAVSWQKDGYIAGSLMCLSTQLKKYICIGRGGIILTEDYDAYKMLKLMSYDGRDLSTPYDSENHVKTIGYHYYMEPESAARGLLIMEERNESIGAYGGSENYPDIRKWIKN